MNRTVVVLFLGSVLSAAGTLPAEVVVDTPDIATLAALPQSVAVSVASPTQPGANVTPVTIHQNLQPPAEVFAQLSKQGGISLVAWPEGLWDHMGVKTFTLNADRQPFWSVTLQAADACGLSIRRSVSGDSTRSVELHPARQSLAPTQISVAGPLVMVAESVSRQQKTDLARGQTQAQCTLDLRVYADPALKNYRFLAVPELDEATDDNGNSLVPAKPDTSILPPAAALVTLHQVPLALPADPGKRIQTLHGSLTLLLASQTEDFVIDPLAQNAQARQIGKYTYTWQGMTRKEDGYELTLHIKGPADEMSVAVRDLIVSPQSILPVDASGNRYEISDIAATFSAKKITGVGNAIYSLTVKPARAAQTGPIRTITWRLPKEIANQEVQFEFHDLPMP